MTTITQTRLNPYVGPRAFQRGETLYGRDREVMDLLDLLIAERIVLLHSPSGAGKTSLVQARLIPEAEREGFKVLPVMRVGLEPPSVGQVADASNRYVLSLLLSLEETLPPDQQTPLAELAGMTLTDYLDRRQAAVNAADELEAEVLIFDQFEEILAVNPTDLTVKEAFFAQVGAVLRDRRRWALFAMREDYLAGLDPYLRSLPTRLSTTYRLDLLDKGAALDAIQEPARQVGTDFTLTAAETLADNLRRVQVQQPDGTTKEQLGPCIEPVQLQVVCRRLWEKLPLGAAQIVEADVESVGDVDTALAGYYADRVGSIARETGVTERAIREWFDHRLITELETRGQVLQGPRQSEGLDNRAAWRLVEAHLVRAEKRRGATWFELAHDRLIGPIRTDNADWREAHLSSWQVRADTWETQGRPKGLLLLNEASEEAERWLDHHHREIVDTEREFLLASREAQAAAEQERRQARRIRWLAVGATIFGVVAIFLAVIASALGVRAKANEIEANSHKEAAVAEQARADEQARDALARKLAALARSHLDDLDRSLLLSLEATYINPEPETFGSLLAGLASSSHLRMFIHGHEGPVYGAAFGPDGRTLASGSDDENIILWDVASGQPIGQPLTGHTDLVWSVAFSPDGKTLASGSKDGDIILWDVATRKPIGQPLKGHTEWVNSVAFSPDGQRLASGSDDGTIILWDVATRKPIGQLLTDDMGLVLSLAFYPDDGDGVLASSSSDGTIMLWDVATRESIGQLTHNEDWVWSVAFSPDGRTLASGSDDGTIMLWDVATVGPSRQITHSEDYSVSSVAFSTDGQVLASASDDGTVMLWDVAAGEPIGQPLTGHNRSVYSVAFSRDGETLASASGDGTIILWDVYASDSLGWALTDHTDWVQSVAFSPDSQKLASASDDGTIMLWDVVTGLPIGQPLTGHDNRVLSVAFSPDGQTLVSSSADKTIILWDVATGEPMGQPLTGHTDSVWSVAFSPDGRTLASASAEGTIILWDVAARKPIRHPLTGHTDWVWSVAFSPDGRTLASGSTDGTIRLWNAATGEPIDRLLTSRTHQFISVAFSPDGQMLASGSKDGTIVRWDVNDWRTIGLPLADHKDFVPSVTFSPDGQMLASGSNDGTIILWDVATGERIGQPLTGHTDSVWSVAFSPDGQRLASGGSDETVFLWDTSLDGWQDRACRIVNRNMTPNEWGQYIGDGERYIRHEPRQATCPHALVKEAEIHAWAGYVGLAKADIMKAVQLAEDIDSAYVSNWVCWFGSIDGFAEIVLPACEHAVESADEGVKAFFRDSRGLARALTGNYVGAIKDFAVFADWLKERGVYEPYGPKRAAWIADLEAGRNPFDKDTLEALRYE